MLSKKQHPPAEADDLVATLRFNRTQRISAIAIGLVLISMIIPIAQLTLQRESAIKSIADSDDVTGNIFFTQRESLVLAISAERWLSGLETKRDVAVRRALLGQRLNVKDSKGISNGQRAHPEYLDSLEQIDECLTNAPEGLLPAAIRPRLRSRCGDALDVLVFEARQLAIDISRTGDDRLRELLENSRIQRRNLVALVASLLLVAVLLGTYLAWSRTRLLGNMKLALSRDAQQLEETRQSLEQLKQEMNERISRETLMRAEDQRLDSAVRMVSSEMRRVTSASQVIERLVNGIDYMLQASLIFVQLFERGRGMDAGYLLRDGISSTFKGSEVGLNQSVSEEIVRIVERLERIGDARIHKSGDVLKNASPELTALIGQLSLPGNSFVVGLREGSEMIGFVLIGRQNERNWHSNELNSVQNVVSNAANAIGSIQSQVLVREVRKTQEVVSQLRELDRLKNEFISNVNHELRTPLTSIIGYLEIIEDQKVSLPSDTSSYLATVRRNADRLLELIENLLIVSRAEDAGNEVQKEEVDLIQIVKESIEMIQHRDSDARVRVDVRSEPARISIHGDRLRLTQIVVNLVTNAMKFSRPNSVVLVEARIVRISAEENVAELRVSDSGIGIPANEIPHLFERFFRASNAERALIPGTGLGLPIVKKFVDDHGGSISVESTENVGTTVTVRLPLVTNPD